MGQMLRGGRSWPSETKLGAGTDSSGNRSTASNGSGKSANVFITGTTEQQDAHRLHLSWLPPSWWCGAPAASGVAC